MEKGRSHKISLLVAMMFAVSETVNVPDEIVKGMKLKCLSVLVADAVCSGASGPIWFLGIPTFLWCLQEAQQARCHEAPDFRDELGERCEMWAPMIFSVSEEGSVRQKGKGEESSWKVKLWSRLASAKALVSGFHGLGLNSDFITSYLDSRDYSHLVYTSF